jgi:hypothetical protein
MMRLIAWYDVVRSERRIHTGAFDDEKSADAVAQEFESYRRQGERKDNVSAPGDIDRSHLLSEIHAEPWLFEASARPFWRALD